MKNGQGTRKWIWRWVNGDLVAVRSAIVFLALSALFYGLLHRPGHNYPLLSWHLENLASESARLLSLMGYDIEADGIWLQSAHFEAKIARGCDAIEPLAIFMASVLAIPLRQWWRKIVGLVIGSSVLLIVNMLRIISLVIIGIHWPSVYRQTHEQVWQAAFIILVFVLWAGWLQWATRSRVRAGAACP